MTQDKKPYAVGLELDPRQRAMLAEMGVRVWLPRPHAALLQQARAARPDRAEAAAPVREPPTVGRMPAPTSAQPERRLLGPRQAVATQDVASTPELTPLPADISGMDWPTLQQAVAACQACPLHAGRTQAVFGVGSRSADWMVVGEAPGQNEDRLGEPFVGQAGKLLDNMLAALALSRHAELDAGAETAADADGPRGVYIANVIKCRPPGNRNPQPDEVARCEHYLRRQVALVQPRVILAMGRFAVHSLLSSSEPIGRLRGRVHHYQGVPVIVTYHPAYLLRDPSFKAGAWQDLCLARATWQAGAAPEPVA